MVNSLTILWGRGEGLCPDIVSEYTLSWWLMLYGYPDPGYLVRLVILRGCRWTEHLVVSFPGPFCGSLVCGDLVCGALVCEDICIWGSRYQFFRYRTWGIYISSLLWINLKGMWL